MVKLIVTEPQSESLKDELAGWRERVTVSISLTEVMRACRLAVTGLDGAAAAAVFEDTQTVLARVQMLDADVPLLRDAGTLDPARLRTLDAIHLAAALSLGEELEALVTYDHRLAAAAGQHKLVVLSPS